VGYFKSIVPRMSTQGVMVFGDIPWSRELRRAWKTIAPRVGLPLGRMGVAVMTRGPT
jgi:hypothetical protein